jgi:hypothetical protein
MKDANCLPLNKSPECGSAAVTADPQSTTSVPTTPSSIERSPRELIQGLPEPSLGNLIRLVINIHGPMTLADLLPALLVQFPHLHTMDAHDTLNDLLFEGFLRLSITGQYMAP